MKQKIIYIVFFTAAIYLPASSKECGKLFNCAVKESLLKEKEKAAAESEEMSSLPASPFSKLLLKL
jgi:hypothetical protein